MILEMRGVQWWLQISDQIISDRVDCILGVLYKYSYSYLYTCSCSMGTLYHWLWKVTSAKKKALEGIAGQLYKYVLVLVAIAPVFVVLLDSLDLIPLPSLNL